MRPPDAAVNDRIGGGVKVFATAGVKVSPLDTGLGGRRVVLIKDGHLRRAFNRVVLGKAIDLSLVHGQLRPSQENRFDFLVAETGAGFIFVLGMRIHADQARQNHRRHG